MFLSLLCGAASTGVCTPEGQGRVLCSSLSARGARFTDLLASVSSQGPLARSWDFGHRKAVNVCLAGAGLRPS